MSQVLFYALGGLQEDGKNLYCIEVDKKIYILDAGSKIPSGDLHGVDLIVPNINHLIANKDRVVGLFLTHAHDEHIGSVYQIIKAINPKVYASNFTMMVLKDKLEKDGVTYNPENLITVKSRSTLDLGSIKVRFFELAHNIPDCCGIDIQKVKYICYIVSGVLACLAGCVYCSRLRAGQPNACDGYELNAIAAVAMGGTSMSGGKGGIQQTVFGILIIGIINNAMNLLGINAYWQDVVLGFIILAAVVSDTARERAAE